MFVLKNYCGCEDCLEVFVFTIQYNIYWNVWLGLSCWIILDVRIVWKDLFNYTMHYLLECYVMIDLVG